MFSPVSVCLSTSGGEGYPILLTGSGGTPISGQDGGGPPILLKGGASMPIWMGGTPISRMGYPPIGRMDGGGTLPPISRMGYPPPKSQVRTAGGGGWYHQPEQHNVYLLRGGLYASCVHAGGLSCIKMSKYTAGTFVDV